MWSTFYVKNRQLAFLSFYFKLTFFIYLYFCTAEDDKVMSKRPVVLIVL